jgi:D-glycero-alpha-D-manno-heptose-7-phosphate kinase
MHLLQGSSRNETRSIVAQAPCRADLAGGTLDLWPLYLFHPGAVTVNFALSIYASCRITPNGGKEIRLRSVDTRKEETFGNLSDLKQAKAYKHALAAQLVKYFSPEGGFTLETDSQSPAGAGISGSSALMIATTAALAKLTGTRMAPEDMRVVAQNVEAQLINVPTGCQDYYPALYGGANAIHLTPGGITREEIKVAPKEIDERFLVVYTGAPRQSGINNWEVFKAHINGDKKVVKNFETISEIAQGMRQALKSANWDEVAHLLREEWKLRRSNHEGISTPLIDRLIAVAAKTGGRAAKVCGAGGGGCVIFMVKDGARERVAEALKINGGEVLPCRVSPNGLTVKSVAYKAAEVAVGV